MDYFDTDSDMNSADTLFNELGDICLYELMLSSDAYVRMIELNMQGFKRLHRHLSKKFHNLYLDIQRESLERFKKGFKSDLRYKEYHPDDIKEHLESWNKVLEEHLKRVGEIIKEIFDRCGYIPCVAKELQCLLYHNLIKNDRAIKKLSDCNWDINAIYKHDIYLHNKMKDIEKDER